MILQPANGDVLVLDGRPRYHSAQCRTVAGKGAQALSLAEAREAGFTPCGICKPDLVDDAPAAVPVMTAVTTRRQFASAAEVQASTEPVLDWGATPVEEQPVAPVPADAALRPSAQPSKRDSARTRLRRLAESQQPRSEDVEQDQAATDRKAREPGATHETWAAEELLASEPVEQSRTRRQPLPVNEAERPAEPEEVLPQERVEPPVRTPPPSAPAPAGGDPGAFGGPLRGARRPAREAVPGRRTALPRGRVVVPPDLRGSRRS